MRYYPMHLTPAARAELERIPIEPSGFTFGQWLRLMMGEGRGAPRGALSHDPPAWIAAESRRALAELDDRDGALRYDVTWIRGRPIFTKQEGTQ